METPPTKCPWSIPRRSVLLAVISIGYALVQQPVLAQFGFENLRRIARHLGERWGFVLSLFLVAIDHHFNFTWRPECDPEGYAISASVIEHNRAA